MSDFSIGNLSPSYLEALKKYDTNLVIDLSEIDIGNELNGNNTYTGDIAEFTSTNTIAPTKEFASMSDGSFESNMNGLSSMMGSWIGDFSSDTMFQSLLKEHPLTSYTNSYNNGGISTGSASSVASTASISYDTKVKSLSAGTYGNSSLSSDQVNNARTIIQVGVSMGMSERDIITAIATALQESSLKNLSGGDRDSVGLFQQRPSCGWENDPDYAKFVSSKGLDWSKSGKSTNATYAAWQFYTHLKGVSNRNSMSITQAAQTVQRSAYPDAYAKWEDEATALVRAALG